MGKFTPGTPKHPASGRKPGTPNKKTVELKSVLDELSVDPVRALFDLLPMLDLEKQADVYMRMMEYLYPKRKAVEHSGVDGGAIEFAPVVTNEERLELVKRLRSES